MEAYRDYVYFGGGGGNELANMIVGYKMPEAGQVLVKDKVFEEKTGTTVANYMTVAKDVSLLASNQHFCVGSESHGNVPHRECCSL